jgi:hypothetical protein
LRIIFDEPSGSVNFAHLLHLYILMLGYGGRRLSKREYERFYRRLDRFINELRRKGVVDVVYVKADPRARRGRKWVVAKPEIIDLVDLIFDGREIGHVRKRFRRHPLRLEAEKFIRKHHSLDDYSWAVLDGFRERYCIDVSNRVIVFAGYVGDGRRIWVFKRWRHRFLRCVFKHHVGRLRDLFRNASSMFSYGVFITLSLDPKTYPSLYVAYKRIGRLFRNFMLLLRRIFKTYPPYICLLDVQKSGNPALHIVLFGIRRIMDHRKLTYILKDLGFGANHWEYVIVCRGGRWVWANQRRKPRDSGMDICDYFVDHLEKLSRDDGSIDDMRKSIYFASNKRFYTYSRRLKVGGGGGRGSPRPVKWIYVGCWYWLYVPEWILKDANITFVSSGKNVWEVMALPYLKPG